VSKCESSKRRIQDINPFVSVKIYEEEFTSESALRILQDEDWDVVVDGSDNFPTKYLINDSCQMMGIPWVYSAILAFEGQVSVFNHGNDGPDYRDLLPTPPPPGDVPSCAEGGVLGVLPGTCGCLQATEVIKILLGKTEGLLSGRVLVFDALAMRFTEVGLQRRKDREPIDQLIDYQGFCSGPKARTSSSPPTPNQPGQRTMDEDETVHSKEVETSNFNSVSPVECLEKLIAGWTPWVLDVRLGTEHDIVALPFTDNVVPHREVNPEVIPKNGEVLIYCKAGIRGKKACARLVELGVDGSRLYNLEGGIMRWQKDVDSSMPRY